MGFWEEDPGCDPGGVLKVQEKKQHGTNFPRPCLCQSQENLHPVLGKKMLRAFAVHMTAWMRQRRTQMQLY